MAVGRGLECEVLPLSLVGEAAGDLGAAGGVERHADGRDGNTVPLVIRVLLLGSLDIIEVVFGIDTRVVPDATPERVVSAAAVEPVVTRLPLDRVEAVVAVQQVVAVAAFHRIIAGPAVLDVVAVVAAGAVIAGTALEPVVAAAAV